MPDLEERVAETLLQRISKEIDLPILAAQQAGALLPTVVRSYLLWQSSGNPLEYAGIIAGTYALGIATMAVSYMATHRLFHQPGSLREALRFTALERACFVPARLLSLGLEGLLVSAGANPLLVGTVVPSAILGLQGIANNRSGRELKQGRSFKEALVEGVRYTGKLFTYPVELAASAYAALRRAPS
ncbi:hypothetical protein J4439_02690 [Candidatus Woesearchaeota archaeon]|nr:hypothetical protein [Candidatus Woesearchaeota archaeon]